MKYLKDTEANINNILIIAGDFNIRNNSWNLSFPYCSSYCDFFTNIVDSVDLHMSKSTNQVTTRYSDNLNDSNLVIDFMFFCPNLLEFDNYSIYSEWRLSSNHALLTIDIVIVKEQVYTKKHMIAKNSKEENKFITKLIKSIKGLNTENISSKEALEYVVQEFTNKTNSIWFKNSKIVNITKHLKS